jgi:hypothetical protein
MGIKCWLGHNWEYYDFVGMQTQPTKRVCLRCGKITHWVGTLHWLWEREVHEPRFWKTPTQLKKIAVASQLRWRMAQKLIEKK